MTKPPWINPNTIPMTGWPPGLLQDDSAQLSRWLSQRGNAKQIVEVNVMRNREKLRRISFDVDDKDNAVINKIVDRALRAGYQRGRLDLEMDLCAAHSNGHPLRLQELLDADGPNFFHDVCGIANTLNRDGETHAETPYLNLFRPHFSAHTEGDQE